MLYVGKAQSLRTRVRSYLHAGGDGRVQVPRLVERAVDVDVVLTPSVKDALLLENELIKRHRPPFNVRLRDDRQYLALRLDPRERWPRLAPVRRFRDDGAQYFGPYTSSQSMREAISELRRIFPLRSCSDAVLRDHARRGRACIEFEMHRCVAPCVDRTDAATYADLVRGTVLFLRGRSGELAERLRERMQAAAEREAFEEAALLRDRIAAVDHVLERQQMVSSRAIDQDVVALAREAGEVEVALLRVREGRIAGATTHGFSDVRIDDAAVLASFLAQHHAAGAAGAVPDEVLVPVALDDDGALAAWLREKAGRRVRVRLPQRGEARERMEMARQNAELSLARRLSARESVAAALDDLGAQLGLASPPHRIECFDVSTLNGVLPVASRVVFEQGRPATGGYRRYRLRPELGGDDYACLREALSRRLARAEEDPLPDLLMVDGGKGQLAVALAALADAGLRVPAIGLAKERDAESSAASPRVRRGGGLKAERIFLPGRKDPLRLPPGSRALLLLQRIRDESHRFAIEFQRRLRERSGRASVLEEIPGIGPGKRRALLRQLGSLRAVREASESALAAVTGLSAADAARIHRFFAREDAAPAAGDEPRPAGSLPVRDRS